MNVKCAVLPKKPSQKKLIIATNLTHNKYVHYMNVITNTFLELIPRLNSCTMKHEVIDIVPKSNQH